jgi:hypothetical protein
MKNYNLLVVFLLNFTVLLAQSPLGLEYQRSFETVSMNTYENYSFSNSAYLLTKDFGNSRLAYGLEIQEAVRGEFGGLYVFGLSTEYDYRFGTAPLSFNVNTFIGGGGGAGAPDGSGLAYRYALGVKAHLTSNISLVTRYSKYDFPTGSIGGSQLQFGFSSGIPSVFNIKLKDSRVLNQSFSFQGIAMEIDANDSGRLHKSYLSKLISVEYAFEFRPKLQGLVRLQAAISEFIDGYMAYYSGLSYSLAKVNRFSCDISALIGSSGGGDMYTNGGLGSLLESGISYSSGDKSVRLSKGVNSSFEGEFSAYYTQLGFKYNFESTALLGSRGNPIESERDYKLTKLRLETGLEVHLAPNAVDYNNLFYEDMSLMSFGIRCPIKDKIELLGQTRWALGGNYGAYAEGIVGMAYKLMNTNKFEVLIPLQIVVAGGGGVDVGKGIGYQVNIEGNYAVTDATYISLCVAKMSMINGNYKPLSFNLGLKQDIYFFVK